MLVLSGVFISVFLSVYSRQADVETETESVARAVVEKKTRYLLGIDVTDKEVIEKSVNSNDRFIDLIDPYELPQNILASLNSFDKATFDFRRIMPQSKFTLIAYNDSMKVSSAIYEPNAVDYVVFHLEDSLWVEKCKREVTILEKQAAGVISSTLSESIEELKLPISLTNSIVDILGWEIDFFYLEKGDRFKILYRQSQVKGELLDIEFISGISFEHRNNIYYAIPYDQGKGVEYFDNRGRSLKKDMLKYPIEFTRISSRYSKRRFHPVDKVFRPHLGTDFAAPRGTPIRATADGKVISARYSPKNGNFVKIRHNATYTTQYLHMSKIARGIRPNVRLRQGQIIGFVGSTGLATGPHLCYRFWKNDRQVDAMKVRLPDSAPVSEKNMTKFELEKMKVINQLDQIYLPEPPWSYVKN